MTVPRDPGWKSALPQVGRIATGRTPAGSILLVMRGAVLFLEIAAVVAGFLVVFLGGGAQEARVDDVTARILISLMVGVVIIAITRIGREGPDVSTAEHLAVSVFRITMRRVLVAAALAPVGMALSWLSGDASYVVFGTGLAMLLMAVSSPTVRRIEQFQTEVDDAGSELVVLAALQRSYR